MTLRQRATTAPWGTHTRRKTKYWILAASSNSRGGSSTKSTVCGEILSQVRRLVYSSFLGRSSADDVVFVQTKATVVVEALCCELRRSVLKRAAGDPPRAIVVQDAFSLCTTSCGFTSPRVACREALIKNDGYYI